MTAASSGLPDVGELRRQLAEVSERFELTSLAASDILYDWMVGGELRWGGAITARLGYLPENVENTLEWWKTLVHPDDLARTVASLEEAMAGTSDRWTGTYRLRKASGAYASVIERAMILRSADGAAARMVGSIVDLTEQAHLGEQLTQSENRYEAVFANSLDAIIVTTPDGAVMDMNPAAQVLFGVEPTMVGRFRASDAYVNSTDRDTLRDLMARDGCVRGYQMRLRRADGSTFLATYNGSLWRDGSGAVLGFVGVIRDVTERSRMEEALRAREALFRAIVENGNEVVGLIDASGQIVYVTPSVRTMGASPEQVVGQPIGVFVHPEDYDRFKAAFDRAIANPESVQGLAPYRAINPAGRTLWVEARFTNQLGNPAIDAIVIHARDVSERVEAEAARNRAEEQFRQAQKMEAIGRLAGGVAHDFNNLLTAITGSAELALHDATSGELRSDLETIREAAYKAAAITRQLLAFSRKQMTCPVVVDVNETVQGFQPLMRRLVSPDVGIEYVLDARCSILIDPVQLEQALLNLVVNANDAMPHGGHLTVRTFSREGDHAVIEVRDSGVGIEERIRARIFEPFFTTKAPGQGTGLGLATVYGIVEQAGGRIEVISAPGKGSTFRMIVPAVEGAAAVTGEHRSAAVSLAGRETILLVDDEASVRLPFARALTRLGYTVIEAKHGRDALTLLSERKGPVDLIITDLVMPEMGGAELIAQVRAARPSQPVIFVSGYSQDVARARGAAQDAPFLQKPFTMDVMVRAVRDTLDRPERAA